VTVSTYQFNYTGTGVKAVNQLANENVPELKGGNGLSIPKFTKT